MKDMFCKNIYNFIKCLILSDIVDYLEKMYFLSKIIDG